MVSGKKFDAEFRGTWGTAAIFERYDGRRAAIPMRQLSAKSRIRLQTLAPEIDAARAQRIADLQEEAGEGLQPEPAATGGMAPVATPSGLPRKVAYAELPDSADLEATYSHLFRQTTSGHVRAMWDMLPQRYQNDLDAVRSELTKKMPAIVWDGRVSIVTKKHRVLDRQQFLLFATPMIAALPEETRQSLRDSLQPLILLIGAVAANDRLKHASVSQTDMATLVEKLSKDVHDELRDVMESSPKPPEGIPTLEVFRFSEEGDTGSVIDARFGKLEPWKKIDGHWLPQSVVDNWDKQVASMMSYDATPGAPDGIVTRVNKILDSLIDAGDQAEFDAAVQSIFTEIGALLPKPGVE